ncbi:hypothetical protein, partial [Pseudomonas sp. 24 E 13]|uniref:hypothetical protein n=1 Tax=Pseudomonas sp. 24 E 13 TaxID=1844095 RepID=UPI001C40020C
GYPRIQACVRPAWFNGAPEIKIKIKSGSLRIVVTSAAALCRSELAREKLTGAAFIQEARVIVDVFREQARSYKRRCAFD